MVRIISRPVLAKGQIVIPQAFRETLGINTGDKVQIELEDDHLIIRKKADPLEVFHEISVSFGSTITMKEIKKEYDGTLFY
ncbi:MAG: AbrB/MazE/SpoVT family DNA-binding domain-containing protein [Candidatus Thermoplasmatota archaeon]|nr:AbrB/MazE/SpoVT family DNA-binding domain-containing protein [Candidatus Thermoplasmatota archaeon]